MGSGKKTQNKSSSQGDLTNIGRKFWEEIHRNTYDVDDYHDIWTEAVKCSDLRALRSYCQQHEEALDTICDIASRENIDVLDAILEPEKDTLDIKRIVRAVKYRRVNSIRRLIETGLKFDSVSREGYTLFQYAVIYDSVDCLLEALSSSLGNRISISLPNISFENETDKRRSETDGCSSHFTRKANHKPIKSYILQRNSEGRNALHTAAIEGYLKSLKLLVTACENELDLDTTDNSGETPVSLAIKEGNAECVKYLVKHGSSLSLKYKSTVSLTQLILKECPRGSEIIEKVLDSCVKNNGDVDFRLLIGRDAETQLDVLYDLYQHCRKDQQFLLHHPVIQCYLAIKWRQLQMLFLARFVTYLLYTAFVTTYVILRTMNYESSLIRAIRIPVCVFSAVVVIVNLLLHSATPAHHFKRFATTAIRISSPVLSLLYVLLDDQQSRWTQQIGSFAILFCWLLLLMNFDIIPQLSHQAYMFLEISYSMLKYMTIFACVVVAFSFSFFVLFVGRDNFNNPWRSLLYTSMILLQGDFDNIPLFDGSQVDTSDSIVIGLLSLLFLIITIIGVLNMLVGLAVKGSEEMETDGFLLYQKKQVETLYGFERFMLFKYMKLCIKPIPENINVKNERRINKKLRIKTLNLKKNLSDVSSDKNIRKMFEKLEEIETKLNYLTDFIMNSEHRNNENDMNV